MQIIPLIIVGLFVYLMFFRRGRGGMGCCGGHIGHDSKGPQDKHTGTPPGDTMGSVIDLKEEDYTVLPPRETPMNRRLSR
jgi:hypothetical protein